jgi:hypothetical protein
MSSDPNFLLSPFIISSCKSIIKACPRISAEEGNSQKSRSWSDERDVLSGGRDDETAVVVREGIGGDEEESGPVVLVAMGGAHQGFPVLEGHLDLAADHRLGGIEVLCLVVMGIARGILDEEDRLQFVEAHFCGFRFRGGWGEVEDRLGGGKIGRESLQDAPILVTKDDCVLAHQTPSDTPRPVCLLMVAKDTRCVNSDGAGLVPRTEVV